MQLNKASKKTSKNAEKTVAAPEKIAAPELASKPQTSKPSKTKKSEGTDMTSGKHHHKSASQSETVPVSTAAVKSSAKQSDAKPVVTKPLADKPARKVHAQEIAELAHSYWVARGHSHGSAEEDWLRAELELTTNQVISSSNFVR